MRLVNQVIAVGDDREPLGIHGAEMPGQRAAEHRHRPRRREDQRDRRHRLAPLGSREPERHAEPDREPERGRRMQRGAAEHESDGEPVAPREERRHCDEAEGEGQLPGMEVALQRVRAGLRDGVAQRQRGADRDDGPARPEESRADARRARQQHRERYEVEAEKQVLQRQARRPNRAGRELVDRCQSRLRIDEHGVPRKRRRLEMPEDRRDVERLVGRAIAVAGRVHRRQEHEHNAKCHMPNANRGTLRHVIWHSSL
jgi:hypothetical protein